MAPAVHSSMTNYQHDLCDQDRYEWAVGEHSMEHSIRRPMGDRPIRCLLFSELPLPGKKFGTLNEPDRHLSTRVRQNLAPTTIFSTFHALSREES